MWYMSLIPLAGEANGGNGTELSLFVQFLLTAGSSTVLVAIINAIINRRKNKNESDSIVHDMMESTLTSSAAWQDRLEKRLDDAEQRADASEKRARAAEDRARAAETASLELREEVKQLIITITARETEIKRLTSQLLNQSADIGAQASKIERASGQIEQASGQILKSLDSDTDDFTDKEEL